MNLPTIGDILTNLIVSLFQNADKITALGIALAGAVYFIKRDDERHREYLALIEKYYTLATTQVTTLEKLVERLDDHEDKSTHA